MVKNEKRNYMNLISLLTAFLINTSFYSLQFQDSNGATVSMSQFQGKKILLVNIASESSKVGQLAGLQQLHQQYGDSVVVIGFPSNSFGHEPLSDAAIRQFCQNNYGVTFMLASKNPIAGPVNQPVYNWLTQVTENSVNNDPVRGDFQKYLVSENGTLIGIFSPSVEPVSDQLTSALSIN
jgi:glutathione peroxidase